MRTSASCWGQQRCTTHRHDTDIGEAQTSAFTKLQRLLEKQGPVVTCSTTGSASCLAQAALCWPESLPAQVSPVPAMLPGFPAVQTWVAQGPDL